MAILGDFSKARELQRALAKLGSPATRKRMNAVLAQTALGLVQSCFLKKQSPRGSPWAPLTSRSGQTLRKTGALFSSLHAVQRANGFSIDTSNRVAHVHNSGATIFPVRAKALAFRLFGRKVFAKKVVIPKRQFIPTTLPGPWRDKILLTADKFVRAIAKTGATP
jgi:phage gpG-like protein